MTTAIEMADRIQRWCDVKPEDEEETAIDLICDAEDLLRDIGSDMVEAAGELLIDVAECEPGSTVDKLLHANIMLRKYDSDETKELKQQVADNAMSELGLIRDLVKLRGLLNSWLERNTEDECLKLEDITRAELDKALDLEGNIAGDRISGLKTVLREGIDLSESHSCTGLVQCADCDWEEKAKAAIDK